MSSDEPFNFMPPDEPTAVYPIGVPKTSEPEPGESPDPAEPPEPPALESSRPTAEEANGFNPMVALAIMGVPALVALAVVILFVVVFSFTS